MSLKVDICAYDAMDNAGGPYVWIQRLPLKLREMGYDVHVNLFSWHDPELGVAYQTLKGLGISVSAEVFNDTEANVRWLLEQAEIRQPDVFLANHVIPAFYAARYLKEAGVATVGVLRSDDPFYQAIADRFVYKPGPFQLSTVACVSDFLCKSVIDKCSELLPVRCIPSGTPIPTKTVTPPTDTLRIAYVGRVVEEQKQVSLLTKAFLRATSEIEGVEATLYGGGNASERVEKIITDAGSSRVKLAGHLSSDEIQERLLESHVIVLLSDYEGTPMAVMEGMACGCVPVCLSIRSGIPELVKNGITGLLVDDRGDGFVAAIRSLREDVALWQKLSRNAREHIIDQYSIEVCSKQWAELINDIYQTGSPGVPFVSPTKIRLQATHPDFAHQDWRTPTAFARLSGKVSNRIRRSRMIAGKIKRLLLGQPRQ